MVNMLQNLVSRLNHFSDHLQGFVLFCFVFCFLFFVFLGGGGVISQFNALGMHM